MNASTPFRRRHHISSFREERSTLKTADDKRESPPRGCLAQERAQGAAFAGGRGGEGRDEHREEDRREGDVGVGVV